MYDHVLGSLQKDHDSIRAMRQLLADELGRLGRDGAVSSTQMRALLGYAIHDPTSYHHLFEAYLVHRLAARRPEAEPTARRINRWHRLVAQLGRRLQAWFDQVGIDGFARRLGFVCLARTYIVVHEALLRAEEKQVFPLLRDCLTPRDWVEATSAFEWSLAPDLPRHLVDSTQPTQPSPSDRQAPQDAQAADAVTRDRTGS